MTSLLQFGNQYIALTINENNERRKPGKMPVTGEMIITCDNCGNYS